MEILEKIKIKLADIAKQKEELTAELRKDFAPMMKPLFEKSNGKIKSIGWVQYTPYFNDGDECVFGVECYMDYGIEFNGESIDESDFFTANTYSISKYLDHDGSYEDWVKRYPQYAIDPVKDADQIELYSIIKEFSSLLSTIPDDFFKDLFGDHVRVTVNCDGTINTEEYEHD